MTSHVVDKCLFFSIHINDSMDQFCITDHADIKRTRDDTVCEQSY